MKPEAEVWLPKAALLDGALEERFSEMTRKWERKWFHVRPRLSTMLLIKEVAPEPTSKALTQAWQSGDTRLYSAITMEGQNQIASAMLGSMIAKKPLRKKDLPLIRRITTPCVQDLLHRFASMFTKLAESNWPETDMGEEHQDRYEFRIDIGRGPAEPWLRLFAPTYLLTDLRKSGLPTGPTKNVLGRLDDALQHQSLPVEALAGKSTIKLNELRHLEPGDVVVLDQVTSDPLPLIIGGKRQAALMCVAEPEGDALRLKICDLGGG